MRRHDVKVVVDYYYAIRGMTALLEKEKRELEGKYNGLRATSYGNPPGGSGNGRTTEDLAERAEALRVSDRIDEIGVRICVLDTDHDKIRGCLDILKGEYKKPAGRGACGCSDGGGIGGKGHAGARLNFRESEKRSAWKTICE